MIAASDRVPLLTRAGSGDPARHGGAQAVLGANVICHLTIRSVIRGLLSRIDGVGFVFEELHLRHRRGSYDQIYDEHLLTTR